MKDSRKNDRSLTDASGEDMVAGIWKRERDFDSELEELEACRLWRPIRICAGMIGNAADER